MFNERLFEEFCYYYISLNTGSRIEKIYIKDVSRGKREIFICFGSVMEI